MVEMGKRPVAPKGQTMRMASKALVGSVFLMSGGVFLGCGGSLEEENLPVETSEEVEQSVVSCAAGYSPSTHWECEWGRGARQRRVPVVHFHYEPS